MDVCVLELPDLLRHLKLLNPFLLKVILIIVLFLNVLFMAALTYHKILELVLSVQWNALCATALAPTGVHLVMSTVM